MGFLLLLRIGVIFINISVKNAEILTFEVHSRNGSFIIMAVYRSRAQTLEGTLDCS